MNPYARIAATGLILAAGLSLANCHVDKLLDTPGASALQVAPAVVSDSTAAGSLHPRVWRLNITTTGVSASVPWSATTTAKAAWLTLDPASGTTPGTITLEATAAGLTTGSHRDTIVLTSPGSNGSMRVPIELRAHPCIVTAVTPGTLTDSLRAADCGAPHRTGRLARVYRFTAAAGDSVSIGVSSSAFNSYLILDTAAAEPNGAAPPAPLAETGDCALAPATACLRYQRLPHSGPYLIEATSVDSGRTGPFTLRLVRPEPPHIPEALGQLASDAVTALPTGSQTSEPSIVIEGVVRDPNDGDSLQLEVEAKPIGAAFTGGGTIVSPRVRHGARASVRLSGLADGTAYHWRARAIDQTGRGGPWAAYGGNREDEADFRINRTPQPPGPPTALGQFKLDGTTAIPPGGATDEQSVLLRGTVSGGSGTLRLEVEVRPRTTPFSHTPTASSTAVPSGGIATVAAAGLSDNTAYHWQARTVDQSGQTSGWAAFGANPDSAADFVIALPVARLVFVDQPSAVTAGSAMTPPVRVAAQDAAGNTLTSFAGDVTIALSNNPGGSTLAGATTVKASAGVATFSDLRLEKAAPGYTFVASSSGLPSVVSSGFDVHAAAATRLTFSTEPGAATAGTAITPPIRVTARDTYGNVATGFTGAVTVAFAANPANATLDGTRSVNAVAGVATFSTLRVDRAAAGYSLAATATGLAGDTSATFDVAPAAATSLAFTAQPGTTAAGAAITPAVEVTARDAFGNTATSFADSVTVALAANSTGATLGGTRSVKAQAGVARFADLRLDRTGSGYTLSATARGLTGATSTAFAIVPGTASRLVFTVAPTAATAGVAITPEVTVTAQDAAGNTVTSFTGQVTIALGDAPAGATLSGTTAANAVNGVASFADLRIRKAGSGFTLVASAGGFTPDTTAPFTVSPAPAQRMVFTKQPGAATAGAGFAAGVTTYDSLDNVATGFTGPVAIAIADNPTGGTLSGVTTRNAVAGVADFVDLSIDRAGNGYTLRASATGLADIKTAPFNVGTGLAQRLVFTTEPTSTAAGTPIAPAVRVTAQDALGNTDASFVSTVTLTLSAGPGGAQLLGATSVEAVAGVATFNDLSADRVGSGYRLRASSGTLTPDTSVAFAVTPGAPAVLAFLVEPGTVTAGAAITPALDVAVRDAHGNAAPAFTGSVTVALGANPAAGTLAGTGTRAVADGKATFADLSINKAASGYTLIASASGLRGDTTAPFDVRPGDAAKLALATAPPSTARNGVALVPQPAVQLQDAHGNPVSQSGVTVTASVAPAGATLGGATATTNGSGAATFAGLTISGTAGTYTLSFGATGVTAVSSAPITLTAGDAVKLATVTQPSAAAQSGVPFTQQPVIHLQDASGNRVSQPGVSVVAAIASGGGTLGGTATVSSDASGAASFADLSITGTAGDRTLGFSATGLTGATSNAISVSAGGATRIAIQAGNNQSAAAGTAVAVPPAVIATDASGNPVSGVAVTFAVTSGGGTVTPTSAIPTGGDGIARVTSWVLGPTAGTNSLSATAGSLQGSPLTFTATATVGAPASLTKVSGDSLTGPVGTALQTPHEVLVRDASGNPVSGVAVSWAAASGGGSVNPTSSSTDAAGRAQTTRTLGPVVGTQSTTATATIGGSPATVTFTITATAGGASQMTLAGGDGQTGTVGAALPTPLSVRVADSYNNPVANVTVSWTVTNGGGSVAPTTSTTNASGIASTTWTLGTRTVPQTARATAAGSPVNFVATATPGPASASASSLVASPTTITASSGSSAATITVTARDQYDNPIPGAFVGLAVTGSDHIVTPLSGLANSSGVFTATLSSTRAEPKTVTATIDGTSVTQQATVTVIPAAAAALRFVAPVSDAAAGAPIAPAPQIEILDAFNNRVTTATHGITMALGQNPAGGTLSGTLTVAAVGGVATFSDLKIDRTGDRYTLVASNGGLTSATSNELTVSPGTAAQLAFTAQPSNTTAGAAITPAVQVTARDAQGNTVGGFTGTVTVAIATNPGGGTLGGTASVAAVAGIATLSDLSINKAGLGYTLRATSGTLTEATSAAFDVAAGAVSASTSSVAAAPDTITAGGSSTVAVTARDASGNPVSGLTVVLSSSRSGDAVTQPSTPTNASGVATGAVSSTTPGSSVISATVGGTAVSQTDTVTVVPGAATTLAFTGQPTNTAAGSAITPAVQIAARDAFGNTATGFTGTVTVALGTNPTGAALGGTTAVAAVLGVATFSTLSVDTVGSGYTLTASASGLTGATSTAFDVTPGPAARLVFTVQPASTTAGSAITPAVQVTALDAEGNTATGFAGSVTLAIGTNPAGGALGGTVTAAAGGGVATFADLTIDKAGDGYTLTARAGALTSATSAAFNIAPGAASQLVFTVPPSDARVDSVIKPPVEVTIADAFGNRVTSAADTVTIAIGHDASLLGNATLSGAKAVPASSGVAVFGDLRIDQIGNGYRLRASRGTLPTVDSAPFNISPL